MNIIYPGAVPERKGISFMEDDVDRQRINWFQKGKDCDKKKL